MCDPTDHVQSYEGAIVLACALLHTPSVQPRAVSSSAEIWKVHTEPVLAALLFAASPCQRGGGMRWVNAAVSALAGEPGPASDVVGMADPFGCRSIGSLDNLSGPQRDSVLLTVRDAVLPWIVAA